MIFEIVVIILLVLILICIGGRDKGLTDRIERIEEKLDKYLQTEQYNLREWDGKH